jgi:hypothetical protein
MKTAPASQIRFTSGFTNTFRYTDPSARISSATTKRSSPVSRSVRIATSLEVCCSTG